MTRLLIFLAVLLAKGPLSPQIIYHTGQDLQMTADAAVTGTQNVGILLDKSGEGVTLARYIVEGNASTVADEIAGEGARVTGNYGQQ